MASFSQPAPATVNHQEIGFVSEKHVATYSEDPSLFFSPVTIRNCLLTWLIPGLGYWLAGRKKTGLIMTVSLFTAFVLGVLLGGDLYPISLSGAEEGKIRAVGAFCQAGMGAPYMLAKAFMSRGTPLNITYDYGTNYFLIAGMINWLSIMDVFDISVKRK